MTESNLLYRHQASPNVEKNGRKLVGAVWGSSGKTVDTFVEAFKNVTMTLPVKIDAISKAGKSR
jgi:hypothetical protein